MKSKLFKNRNFLLLWTSQITSQLAINIMNFLVLVHIFEQTHSSIAASFIWVAYGVPAVILGPIAAAAVDMVDKRKALITSNIIQSVVILIYAVLYQRFLFFSYGVVFLYSVLDQLYVPAEAASLPILTSKKELPQANGLFFLSAQSMAILGFGLAGLISEIIGFTETMLLGSVMLVVAAAATISIKKIGHAGKITINSFEHLVFQFFNRIKEGYDFIRYKPTILFPFLFLIWLQVTLSMLVVNLPSVGTEIIKTKAALAGPFVVGPAGAGALLGALVIPKYLSGKIRKQKIVETSLLAISGSFTFVALVVPRLYIWVGRPLLVLAFFVVGFAYVGALIPTTTYIQVQTPKNLMGRVFGNFWFVANTASLVPVIFSATITEILGVHLMILFIGLIAFSVFAFSRYSMRGVFNGE